MRIPLAVTFCLGLLAGVSVSLVLAGTALATAELYSNNPIASYVPIPGNESAPITSGDRIAWYSLEGSDSEVYTWTPSSGLVQLTSNTGTEDNVRLSGDRLVWHAYDGSSPGEIFTWTPAGGTVQITNDANPDYSPEVSGDRIVWCCDEGGGYVLYTWTPGGGIVQVDRSAGYYHVGVGVSADRIVWFRAGGSDGGTDGEIFTWTPAGGVQQITTNIREDSNPVVSGSRIVWNAYDGSDWEIFTWTPSGGVVQLTDNSRTDGAQHVSGDRIAWRMDEPATYRVYTWTPTEGTEEIGSGYGYFVPHVDGDRIAWTGTNDRLYTWSPTYGTLLAIDAKCSYPTISGDRMAWLDQSDSVHTGTPTVVPDPTITSVQPALGPDSGGNTVVIHGTDFIRVTGLTGVMFGDAQATSYSLDSETQITAVAPPRPAGTYRIQVNAFNGSTADTFTDDYRYYGAPTVTAVSPLTGAGAGGTTVVITGTDFAQMSGPGAVKFGAADAAGYVVDSQTRITATTPPHVPGTAQVTVTTPAGQNQDTPGDDFRFTPRPGLSEQFTTARITTNSHDDDVPMVSGDRIVWVADPDGTDYEMYTWTPSNGAVRITNNAHDDDLPAVSGDRIVWSGTGGTDAGLDWEIFTWTPTDGIVQLTRNDVDDVGADVSGDRIAWMRAWWTNPSNPMWEIYTWTPEGGVQQVSHSNDNDVYPSVSGDRIAWTMPDAGIGVVLTWTPLDGITVAYSGEHLVDYAVVSGDRIAACGRSKGIFLWTPTSGTWLSTDTLGGDLAISGDRVVWDALSGSTQQVFSWTPTEGIVQISSTTSSAESPNVSGERVVWVDAGDSGVDSEIWSWTPSVGAIQVTNNTLDDVYPAVSSTRVVWLDLLTAANGEVYTAVPGIAPNRFDDSDRHITYSLSTSWTSFGATSASGGGYMRANTRGSSATVYFDGTRLDWIAMKGTTTGKADVYLDDALKGTVDLAAPSATYQVNVWSSGTVAAGVHKFSIVWNTGNTAGKFITLDRVEVAGNLVYPPPSITSLSPTGGSTAGGTSVTINGTGFTGLSGASAVTFGGVNARSYTVNSSTKVTAVAPAHAAATVRVQVTASGGTTPDTFADDFTYAVAPPTTRVDLAATTTGGLTVSGIWAPYASASARNGSYLRSSTSGAHLVIAFKGTRLDWITMKGTTGAIADIYVDGSPTKTTSINLYASPAVYQQNLFTTGILPDGYHTVKIVRSTSSVSGRYLTIDAVEVAGTLVSPTRIEENASPSPFTWNPATWTTRTTTSASGGTYKYINTPGANVTFSFTGVGFKLIAKTAPNYGNLTVTVDGVSQTVSLYSSSATYKKIVFTKFSTPGMHTVKISRTGTKSSSSTGYTIDLDAIDLYGVAG